MQTSFSNRYKKLNARQQQAVDAIYGPVLVIAGPGSGKTEILAVRIANILRKTDTNPSNILCLTFTENAAHNMRERLRNIIGQDAYKVAIHTFHSFGMDILNRFRYKLDQDEELTPIDDIESSRIFHEIIADLPWDHAWKRISRLNTLKHTISLLKNAGINPKEFRAILSHNEQILNHIGPFIQDYSSKIFSLGQKKVDKIEKVRLFEAMHAGAKKQLSKFPTKYHLYETLASSILRGMDDTLHAIQSDTDTKPITAWKNKWLIKTSKSWHLAENEKMNDSIALLDIYDAYSESLESKGLIDFSDMILRAIHLLETDDQVSASLAEQYQWVLIDEYQDTNEAQLRLITALLSVSIESPNIFAVGDDDQSIYKFQGANTRNFRIFHDLYPETNLIVLEQNYRSFKEIIDFSRAIMNTSNQGLHAIFPGCTKVFDAVRGTGGSIKPKKFDTELQELSWVAHDIEKKIQEGIAPKDIAVITKKNATLEHIAKMLLQKNIAVHISKEENIFDDEIVVIVQQILQYTHSLSINNDRDDILLTILAHPMWKIHRLTLWELSRQIYHSRRKDKKSWIETLRTNSDKNLSKIAHFFIELSLASHTKRLEEIIDIVTGANILHISDEYNDLGAREQFTLLIDNEVNIFQSPLYEYYFSQKTLDSNPTLYARYLANVRKLIESIRSFRKSKGRLMLEDFANYIELINTYNVSLSTSNLIGSEDAVQCITAHKSKGLEYESVYAIGLTQKNYKHGKNTSNPLPSNLSLAPEKDDDEDILRLIYTVCTRAKNELFLTYSSKNLGEKVDTLVSVLGDTQGWIDMSPGGANDEKISLLQSEYSNIFDLPYIGDEANFLQNIIQKNFALSPTAIQNFLDISNGGPQKFLANNILRFPQAKNENAIYGTAIHKGLEDFFKDYSMQGTYKKSILFDSFSKKLLEDGIEEKKEKELLDRGYANLEKLYGYISQQDYHELHLEHRFHNTYLDDIKITGAIDRIEITHDGKLIITDYKTGGGFSNLYGGSGYEAIKKWKYRLQLVFYALLFQQSPRWSSIKIREFRLLFVDPDKKTNEFYEIIEYIQEDEIARLTKLIKIIMMKINNLDFPDISRYHPSITGIRQFEEDLLNNII